MTLKEWEFLAHRCGRAGNIHVDGERWGQIYGDANPDVAHHWIPTRAKEGKLKLYNATFKDNIIFHRDGEWTSFGKKRTAHLDSMMTGIRHRRLIRGEWCSAEGLVFPEFDPNVHVIDYLPPNIEELPYYIGMTTDITLPLCVAGSRMMKSRALSYQHRNGGIQTR